MNASIYATLSSQPKSQCKTTISLLSDDDKDNDDVGSLLKNDMTLVYKSNKWQ